MLALGRSFLPMNEPWTLMWPVNVVPLLTVSCAMSTCGFGGSTSCYRAGQTMRSRGVVYAGYSGYSEKAIARSELALAQSVIKTIVKDDIGTGNEST